MKNKIDSIKSVTHKILKFEAKFASHDVRYDAKALISSKMILIAFDKAHWIKEDQAINETSQFIRALR